MLFQDALTLDAPKRTADGYLAVRAKAARTGVYDYLASEVGAPDSFKPGDTVKVYRDEAEVFSADAVRSFLARPITNDHPRQAVTADNWKLHAVGTVMGAMRDKDYLAFDLVLMDAAAIADVEAGKRELSNGYQCTLDWTAGTAPDGTRYDARQVGIKGNHVALVDRGRAGSECAIKDGERFAICDANPAALADFTKQKEPVMAGTIIVDGLPVSLADEAAVRAVINKKDQAIADANAALTDANAKLSEATGKIAALDKSLADAKAELDPANLDKRVADRAALVTQAKAVKSDIVTDGKTDAEIRRAVVASRLGDAATQGMDDAAISGAFAVVAAGAGTNDASNRVASFTPAFATDTASIRDAAKRFRAA